MSKQTVVVVLSALAVVCAALLPSACLGFVPTAPATVSRRQAVLQDQRVFASRVLTPSSGSSSRTFMANNDDDWTTKQQQVQQSAMIGGAGVSNAGEPPFEIRGFSLGNLVIVTGILVTVLSFAEYLTESGGEGLNISGLGFVYGIPIFLAGAALKYAEIEPVPCFSTPEGEQAFDKRATETIQKIKQDVTRHRYGDEAHLDTTVKKLGLVVPGKSYPQLQELRQEQDENGELAFTMVWQSIDTPYKMWADERRVKKYETFFGPGVHADVVKIDAENRLVGIRLTTGERKPSKDEQEETAGSTTEATQSA